MPEKETYKSEGYAKSHIFTIRTSSQWSHWLHNRAAENNLSRSEMIDLICEEWSKQKNKPLPPRRWPPEVS